MREELGDRIVRAPPRTRDALNLPTTRVIEEIYHGSERLALLEFLLRLQLEGENDVDVLLQFLDGNGMLGEELVLLGSRVEGLIREVHDLADGVEGLDDVDIVAKANELGLCAGVRHVHGVVADHANSGETCTNGERSIMSVGEKDVLVDHISLDHLDGLTLDLGENPNALPVAKGTGDFILRKTGLDEGVEELESFEVLKRAIHTADDTENSLVAIPDHGLVGIDCERLTVDSGEQRLKFRHPVQTGLLDHHFRTGVRTDRIAETVPRNVSSVSNRLNLMGHFVSPLV